MKSLLPILSLVIGSVSVTQVQAEYGLKNFKVVMPGALYRGAGNGNRAPMNDSSLKALCQAGFSRVYYLYGKGPNKSLNCGSNTIEYKTAAYSTSRDFEKPILKAIYNAIQNGSGPVYPHCWYGVHASGYVAAVALRQFCGYSAEQAVSYWNSHIASASLRYPKVQNKIRNFRPDPNLQISSSQASRHCP